MMVLAEETDVVGHAQDYLASRADAGGNPYDATRVMAVHSELGDAELTKARRRLDAIDRDDDPLCVVISALSLAHRSASEARSASGAAPRDPRARQPARSAADGRRDA